jgi:hypothetical protein
MAKRKTFESEQNEGAQLSSELVSDRAMVVNLEIMILVGLGPLGRGSHEAPGGPLRHLV